MEKYRFFNPISALVFAVGSYTSSVVFSGRFDAGDVVAAVLFGFLAGAWNEIDRLSNELAQTKDASNTYRKLGKL